MGFGLGFGAKMRELLKDTVIACAIRMFPMRGPRPSYRPEFPSTFLEQAAKLAQQRTAPYQIRQRALLVLLLHRQPLVSNIEAADGVQLHLRSGQRWRCRWAQGDFSLEDEPGRGRKAGVSPAGPRVG